MTSRNRITRSCKSQWKVWLATLLMLAVFPVAAYAEETPITGDALFDEVRGLLQDYHLSNVSEEELINAAIEGMLYSLRDPYTVYLNADEWNDYANTIEQNYVGIGIRLGIDENGVFAQEVFPDSPASEAGILKGDYIVAVNGNSALDKTTDEIVSMIAGEESSQVNVTVNRRGDAKTFTMTRRSIQMPNVENKWIAEGYGYIRIQSFSMDADEKFEEYMFKMKNSGLQGLVIDVRGNPGGYLDTVAYIAGEFLEDGVIMNTRDKEGINSPLTIQNGYSVDVPVVILIDEQSASGSEVLAGALQDHQLATVIGVQSYGKGSVQSIFPLSNGGVLKTTVQEYLTPNGHPVNDRGIIPDIEVQGSLPQLLTAFREVGLTKLNVKANQRELFINGVNFDEILPFVQQEDRVYVHSRTLAALVGMQAEWDGTQRQVVLDGHGNRLVFSVDSPDIYQKNGMTYIDLTQFAVQAKGFTWSLQDGELTISIEPTL